MVCLICKNKNEISIETEGGPIFNICTKCIDKFPDWILDNYYLIEYGKIITFEYNNKKMHLPNDKRIIKGFAKKFREHYAIIQ